MIKHIITFCFCLTLIACQNKKPVEYNQEHWIELQRQTVEQLRAKSFGEAATSLSQSIDMADDEIKHWDYIRMGLVSLPADLALPLVDKALKLKSIKKNDQQLFGFSKVYTQLQELEKALKTVNQAIDIEYNEDYVFWRARLYLMLKEHNLAEKDYQWLLEKDDSKDIYISQYASLLNHLGKTKEAKALLEKYKDNPKLLYKSIILALRDDNKAEAEKQFKHLKTISTPSDMDEQTKLEIGELASWLDDPEYSLELLSTVKEGDKISQAKLIMGRVMMDQENYDRAIIMFRQAQNGIEEHAILAYLFEADAHRLLEEPKLGIRTLNQALDVFEGNKELLYSRAMMNESEGKFSAMEKDLHTIIASDDNHYDALNALGYSWAERNIKLDDAFKLIQKAHELAPENVAILDSMGWVHYRLGNLKQARHYLELATADGIEDKLMLEHLLEVLEALEDDKAANRIRTMIKTQFNDSGETTE
ncbi:tetratricopeptide repeat protein [Marinicella rhabdoformis]|uniref:tetratricopeptide repeat protein n=1 Tax=Marinicella rhabdoformis TaxID=2580566 RepID=UPI0012AED85B|nr:hypothetical protein [Marinicella rhabdoformis]